MLYRYAGAFAVFLILLPTMPSPAESLWAAKSDSMFTDVKAKRVGDLVTIVIAEASSSSLKASTGYDKSLDHSNKAGIGPFLKLVPELGFSSSQKGAASGETTMTSKLVAKVTAKVTKVLENGNLEVQAERTVVTNDEKQDITLTGVVRPEDIGTDNTVLSSSLSDVQIKCTGKGPIGNRQKEGIISKILRFIF